MSDESSKPLSDIEFDMQMRNAMMIENSKEVMDFLEDVSKKVSDHQELAQQVIAEGSTNMSNSLLWYAQFMKLTNVMDILATAVRQAKEELTK